MKNLILTFFLFLLSVALTAQTGYEKNPYVIYKTTEKNGQYIVDYTFKDYHDKLCNIEYVLDKKSTLYDINKYGVPESIYDSYYVTPEIIAQRHRIIKNGLYKQEGNIILPDKNAMINYYAPYTKVIADWIIYYLKKNYKDTRLNRIKMAMSFVQDIPYGIPKDVTKDDKATGGIITTPEIIIDGFGDCDSKAIMFAGILCYLINPSDIRFAGEPGHFYTIIKDAETNIVRNGTTTYFELQDGTYLVAETAGPGKLPFGEKNNRGYSSANIYKIVFDPRH